MAQAYTRFTRLVHSAAPLPLALLALTAFAQARPPASPGGREVRLLTLDGVINPLTARYLERELREAASSRAALVVLRLDTPGGLESSMRKMAEAILASRVPVAVYVAPPGGRAASAGMFLTIAAHVAAMAPGTNIGAAHPVGIGGARADSVMTGKVVNDAAALARALATERGRNVAWVEEAVRRSVSITATEALERDVIDLVARDLDELLRWLDGRQLRTNAGEVTVRTAGTRLVEQPMRLHERMLHVITDPNVAYLLFTIAMVGIMAELYNPGMIFPGLTGAVSLMLALVAFGSLPINWAGVLLLLLAAGLTIGELYAEGFGVFGVGALVAFVLGSLLLYEPFGVPSPALPAVRVSPWLIAVTTAGMGAFLVLLVRALMRSRRVPVAAGPQALVGRTGVALSSLEPTGQVRIDGEVWSAVVEDEPVRAGESVEVAGVEGVTLRVRRPFV
ncbi:MAG: nodulation protein NfeD [Gemmatimonadota bacterium]|nr:nodulation protein NfeD [Gemmatimonadota bacterium]